MSTWPASAAAVMFCKTLPQWLKPFLLTALLDARLKACSTKCLTRLPLGAFAPTTDVSTAICSKDKSPAARSQDIALGPDHRARFSYDDLRGLFTCGLPRAQVGVQKKDANLRALAPLGWMHVMFVPVRAVVHTTRLCTGYARLGKAVCDVAHMGGDRSPGGPGPG